MKILLNFLGFLWCLPWSVLMWVFGILFVVCWQISFVLPRKNLSVIWYIHYDSFFYKFMEWRGYQGFCIGNNIFICPDGRDELVNLRTLDHEQEHRVQFYKYGILFPFLYIFESIKIFFFNKNLHSYYDNVFEIAARKAAGQMVKIPKAVWAQGPKDRWMWW